MDNIIRHIDAHCPQCNRRDLIRYLYNMGAVSPYVEYHLSIWNRYLRLLVELRGQHNRKMKARNQVVAEFKITKHTFNYIRKRYRLK